MAKSAFQSQVANLDVSRKIDQNGEQIYAVDAGTNDDYVIALSPPLSAYVDGMVINFKANTANTAATGKPTLNVNGLGAKAIKKLNDVAPATDDIEAGQIVSVVFNASSDTFQMQSQIANVSGGGGGGGGVVQTVQTIYTTSASTTSTTYVATPIQVTITPTDSTHKVRVSFLGISGHVNSGLDAVSIALYRDAVNISPSPLSLSCYSRVDNNFALSTLAVDLIDSPGVVTPVTYTIYMATASSGLTAYIGRPGSSAIISPSYFTAQEILP